MTLNPGESQAVCREFPMWMQWALRYGNPMFIPREFGEDEGYAKFDLGSQLYLLMKNLHQDYRSLMTMTTEEREFYFRSELEFFEKQNKENENIGNNG